MWPCSLQFDETRRYCACTKTRASGRKHLVASSMDGALVRCKKIRERTAPGTWWIVTTAVRVARFDELVGIPIFILSAFGSGCQ